MAARLSVPTWCSTRERQKPWRRRRRCSLTSRGSLGKTGRRARQRSAGAARRIHSLPLRRSQPPGAFRRPRTVGRSRFARSGSREARRRRRLDGAYTVAGGGRVGFRETHTREDSRGLRKAATVIHRAIFTPDPPFGDAALPARVVPLTLEACGAGGGCAHSGSQSGEGNTETICVTVEIREGASSR